MRTKTSRWNLLRLKVKHFEKSWQLPANAYHGSDRAQVIWQQIWSALLRRSPQRLATTAASGPALDTFQPVGGQGCPASSLTAVLEASTCRLQA